MTEHKPLWELSKTVKSECPHCGKEITLTDIFARVVDPRHVCRYEYMDFKDALLVREIIYKGKCGCGKSVFVEMVEEL